MNSYKNPLVFEIKINVCEKDSFIKSICKTLDFPDYISNWDAIIDMMRGFYSSNQKDILIIIETEQSECDVIKEFDLAVEFANEFLAKYSRKITVALFEKQ